MHLQFINKKSLKLNVCFLVCPMSQNLFSDPGFKSTNLALVYHKYLFQVGNCLAEIPGVDRILSSFLDTYWCSYHKFLFEHKCRCFAFLIHQIWHLKEKKRDLVIDLSYLLLYGGARPRCNFIIIKYDIY